MNKFHSFFAEGILGFIRMTLWRVGHRGDYKNHSYKPDEPTVLQKGVAYYVDVKNATLNDEGFPVSFPLRVLDSDEQVCNLAHEESK